LKEKEAALKEKEAALKEKEAALKRAYKAEEENKRLRQELDLKAEGSGSARV
jgi:cell shape-determining protein MreC